MEAPYVKKNSGGNIQLHTRPSSWPTRTKYSLWLNASELPLHRVRGRLEVGHLRTRTLRDRYRVINHSNRDGKLPLIDSTLLSTLPSNTRQISKLHAKEEASFMEKPLSIEQKRCRSDLQFAQKQVHKIPTFHKEETPGKNGQKGTNCVTQDTTPVYVPLPPSRLGRNSLDYWLTVYQGKSCRHTRCDDVHRAKDESTAKESDNKGEEDDGSRNVQRTEQTANGSSVGRMVNIIPRQKGNEHDEESFIKQGRATGAPSRYNGRVHFERKLLQNEAVKSEDQELLHLHSCTRNYRGSHTKVAQKKINKCSSQSSHLHVYRNVSGADFGHVTDVTPPPSPPNMGLAINLRNYRSVH